MVCLLLFIFVQQGVDAEEKFRLIATAVEVNQCMYLDDACHNL